MVAWETESIDWNSGWKISKKVNIKVKIYEWIKEAIKVGCLNKRDVHLSKERVLNEKQLIASFMGDADSYEFERFGDETFCNISYTSIKRLGLHANGGRKTDDVLNGLREAAFNISNEILETKIS